MIARKLSAMYSRLYAAFGPQSWWPGDSAFEVSVGAILTQNTNWANVEKAIKQLKQEKKLSAEALHALPEHQLAQLIRSAGFFNIKARRLKNFVCFLREEYQGSMKKLAKDNPVVIRKKLLAINGIGPETADSIMLYALELPVFVIDAYTKRILSRHGILKHHDSYDSYQALFHRHFDRDAQMFNEYHALLVRLAKIHCRTRPICRQCPLQGI